MANIKCSRDTSFSFFMIFFAVFGVSFGTSHWAVASDSTIYHGLWQFCGNNDDDRNCDTIDEADTNLWVVRGCMIAAALCYLISFVLYWVWMCKPKSYLRLRGAGGTGAAAMSLALLAACFTSVAVVIFGVEYEDIEVLGWSYLLACISCLNFINCIATLAVTSCCFHGEGPSVNPPGRAMTVITTETPPVQHPGHYPAYGSAPVPYYANPAAYGSAPGPYYSNPAAQLEDTFPPPDYDNPKLYPTAPLAQLY